MQRAAEFVRDLGNECEYVPKGRILEAVASSLNEGRGDRE